MLPALRKTLGHLWAANLTKKHPEIPLFSGSAYFSNHVPKVLTKKWVEHGGEISSGATLDARARYFFAMDPSDPWAVKLFANSVVVIHAGWIVHCIEDAFLVPIAEYILDDKFTPGLPYRLNTNVSGVRVPFSEQEDHIGTEYGPTPVQASDTPSTPTSIPHKRRREQAYFDSPSGSFVFSAFDKDGLPRRPRKSRKLRFDPSFSPRSGEPGNETIQLPVLDWFEDRQDNQLNKRHSQHASDCLVSTAVQMPDTPDSPFTSKSPTLPHQHLLTCEHLQDQIRLSPPAISVDIREDKPTASTRTIDFTNLPLPTRRRFPMPANNTKSGDTTVLSSITKLTENETKTPKKISFADHAQVCVYRVSPQRPDSQAFDLAQQLLEVNDETRTAAKKVKSYTEPIGVTHDLAPQPCSVEMNGENPARRLDGDQLKNDTLTLTMEDVEATRCRLLESAMANGVEDGQLATLFELGRTFRGMTFRHVW